MSKLVTILLLEDEQRWIDLFERIIDDIKREKAPAYDVRHRCASTLDAAKHLLDSRSEEHPNIIVSDVYIERSDIVEDARRQTDAFVSAMAQLCSDKGKIAEEAVRTLLELGRADYDMSRHYERSGLQLLNTVRHSANPNVLFILWSSKLFCSVAHLKEVTRLKRGPDFILPKPSSAVDDDPDLLDRLRMGVDAVGSGVWDQVRKLLEPQQLTTKQST